MSKIVSCMMPRNFFQCCFVWTCCGDDVCLERMNGCCCRETRNRIHLRNKSDGKAIHVMQLPGSPFRAWRSCGLFCLGTGPARRAELYDGRCVWLDDFHFRPG